MVITIALVNPNPAISGLIRGICRRNSYRDAVHRSERTNTVPVPELLPVTAHCECVFPVRLTFAARVDTVTSGL